MTEQGELGDASITKMTKKRQPHHFSGFTFKIM